MEATWVKHIISMLTFLANYHLKRVAMYWKIVNNPLPEIINAYTQCQDDPATQQLITDFSSEVNVGAVTVGLYVTK